MPITVLQRRVYTDILLSLCSLYKSQSKIIFHIRQFVRRLLTHIILLAGHTIGRLTDFTTVATKNTAEFGYGK